MASTPLIKIDNYYLKREDLNPTGSAKDRSLSQQLLALHQQNITRAVISSSGNAALSALYYCHQYQIDLTIFIPPNINPQKLALLQNQSHQVNLVTNPVKAALEFSRTHQAFNLRQSTDPHALLGYRQIGLEIVKQLPLVSSIFIPVGSGTTLLGISQALPPAVKIFAVQPASHPSIVSYFEKNYSPEVTTLTDALSVKYLPLKKRVIDAINHSSGSGLVITNRELIGAQKILEAHHISTSAEGALALAGYFKAETRFNLGSNPVILLTGAKR